MDWETFRDEGLKRLLTCYPYESVKKGYPPEFERGLRMSIHEAYNRLTLAGLAEKLTLQEAEPIWQMIDSIFSYGNTTTRDWLDNIERRRLEKIEREKLRKQGRCMLPAR